MGLIAWGISALLLAGGGALLARRFARDAYAAFWIIIAGAALQFAAAVTLLSPFAAITAVGILCCQAGFFIVALIVAAPQARTYAHPHRPRGRALIIAIPLAAMMLLTAIEQLILPVSNVDDRNYRASRAAYWMQQRSIGGFETHNDRQVAFPPGGSLPFLWGILFTRAETPGLLATWAAYPLVAVGMYVLLRELRLSAFVAACGAALFCFTPIVLSHTRGLAPEMWLTLFALGCAFWSVRARRKHARHPLDFFFAGLFAVLACAVRVTALPLVMMVMILAPLLSGKGHRLLNAGFAALGVATGVIFSGLLPVLVFNLRDSGHPLGGAEFRHVHAAGLSAMQLRTHAARALVTLLEPPVNPAPIREARMGFARALDAQHELAMEDQPWPGRYGPHIQTWAEDYSIAGIAWLGALLISAGGAVIAIIKTWPDVQLRGLHILALLGLPFLVGVMFFVRWSGIMGRFWIAPAALGMAVLVLLLARAAEQRKWIGVASLVIAALVIVPAAIARVMDFKGALAEPAPIVALDDPFFEALAHIPESSSILLVAGQGTRDYPLFRPRDAFANRVTSWGKSPFDPLRMQQILDRSGVTHVLIENDQTGDFYWSPPLKTPPMVQWLEKNPAFRQIPLEYSPGMRLFERRLSSH